MTLPRLIVRIEKTDGAGRPLPGKAWEVDMTRTCLTSDFRLADCLEGGLPYLQGMRATLGAVDLEMSETITRWMLDGGGGHALPSEQHAFADLPLRVAGDFHERLGRWLAAIGVEARETACAKAIKHKIDGWLWREAEILRRIAPLRNELDLVEQATLWTGPTEMYFDRVFETYEDTPAAAVDDAGGRLHAWVCLPRKWDGVAFDDLSDLLSPADAIDANLTEHHEGAADYLVEVAALERFIEDWRSRHGLVSEADIEEVSSERSDALLKDPELLAFLEEWNAKQEIVSYFPCSDRLAPVAEGIGKKKIVARAKKMLAEAEAELAAYRAAWRPWRFEANAEMARPGVAGVGSFLGAQRALAMFDLVNPRVGS